MKGFFFCAENRILGANAMLEIFEAIIGFFIDLFFGGNNSAHATSELLNSQEVADYVYPDPPESDTLSGERLTLKDINKHMEDAGK